MARDAVVSNPRLLWLLLSLICALLFLFRLIGARRQRRRTTGSGLGRGLHCRVGADVFVVDDFSVVKRSLRGTWTP